MTPTFGTSLAGYQGTIPRLLDQAAERDPGGIWLRTDDLQLTFRQAAERVGGAATELADAGIGRGDLIMLTAKTTPDYLLSWLALAALGAVTVPVNPASAPAELAGLIGQVRPKAVLTDAALRPQVDQAVAGAGTEQGCAPAGPWTDQPRVGERAVEGGAPAGPWTDQPRVGERAVG